MAILGNRLLMPVIVLCILAFVIDMRAKKIISELKETIQEKDAQIEYLENTQKQARINDLNFQLQHCRETVRWHNKEFHPDYHNMIRNQPN